MNSSEAANPSKSWIQTYSGLAFEPLKPDSRLIRLEDIAHALSNQCRFTGHVREFYSVAEHSVRVLDEVRKKTRNLMTHKKALLHDATEGYLIDLARPVKKDPRMIAFVEVEAGLEFAIVEAFKLEGLPSEDPLISEADLRMCNAERLALMGPPPHPWGMLPDASQVSTYGIGWSPKRAKREFLAAARYLGIK